MEKFVFGINLEKALILLANQCMLIISVRNPQTLALKPNGNTVISIHLSLINGCFNSTTVEASSYDREEWPIKLKKLLPGLLQKKFVNL